MQPKDLPAGSHVIVVWNGFTGHLVEGRRYRAMLEDLSKKTDIIVEVVVPFKEGAEFIEAAVGKTRWEIRSNQEVIHVPSKILINAESYSGFIFDYRSDPSSLSQMEVIPLYDYYSR